MTDVSLVPLTRGEIPLTRPWFEDTETQRWLGGPEWPEMALRLAHDPETTWYGLPRWGRFVWLARVEGKLVGLVDVELYGDRTAGLALVVDPLLRGQGMGGRILRAVAARPELENTDILRAGIEPENRASVRCFERAGFSAESDEPDEEGYVYFSRSVR